MDLFDFSASVAKLLSTLIVTVVCVSTANSTQKFLSLYALMHAFFYNFSMFGLMLVSSLFCDIFGAKCFYSAVHVTCQTVDPLLCYLSPGIYVNEIWHSIGHVFVYLVYPYWHITPYTSDLHRHCCLGKHYSLHQERPTSQRLCRTARNTKWQRWQHPCVKLYMCIKLLDVFVAIFKLNIPTSLVKASIQWVGALSRTLATLCPVMLLRVERHHQPDPWSCGSTFLWLLTTLTSSGQKVQCSSSSRLHCRILRKMVNQRKRHQSQVSWCRQ